MRKVIIDCDNTAGMSGRPMDDALAILYLLGQSPEVEVIGITCTVGNGNADEVYECNRRMLDEIGYDHIPLLRGSDEECQAHSQAATFLAKSVAAAPGEITVLAIGALGNLRSAALADPNFYQQLAGIVLMGGITEPLFIHGDIPLDELNFSFQAASAVQVLANASSVTDVSIITGNNCLDNSDFPREEFLLGLDTTHNEGGRYIAQKCGYRFDDKLTGYGADSSYCWDGVAAAYIVRPELFEDHPTDCYINQLDMKRGFLHPCSEADHQLINARVNLPVVRSREHLQEELYRGWRSFHLKR